MRKFLPMIVMALALAACSAASGQDAALAERVQRLEDERDIRDLLVRYGEYLDAKDYASYSALFASDGTWTGGFGSATGPDAIQQLLEENLGKAERGYINKEKFHLMTTMVVDVEGDSATARSRYMVYEATPDGRPLAHHAGRYSDTFVRENGAWKFKSRTTTGVIPYRESN